VKKKRTTKGKKANLIEGGDQADEVRAAISNGNLGENRGGHITRGTILTPDLVVKVGEGRQEKKGDTERYRGNTVGPRGRPDRKTKWKIRKRKEK